MEDLPSSLYLKRSGKPFTSKYKVPFPNSNHSNLSKTRRFQIFHSTDTDIQQLSLQTLSVLLKTLYTPPSLDPDAMAVDDSESSTLHDKEIKEVVIEGIAVKMCNICLSELEEPEKNNARPAVRVLGAGITAQGQRNFISFSDKVMNLSFVSR
jgi:hypothetical protein